MKICIKCQIISLEVGQSHLFENANPESVKAAACRYGKILGRKYRTAKQQGGVMVWRDA